MEHLRPVGHGLSGVTTLRSPSTQVVSDGVFAVLLALLNAAAPGGNASLPARPAVVDTPAGSGAFHHRDEGSAEDAVLALDVLAWVFAAASTGAQVTPGAADGLTVRVPGVPHSAVEHTEPVAGVTGRTPGGAGRLAGELGDDSGQPRYALERTSEAGAARASLAPTGLPHPVPQTQSAAVVASPDGDVSTGMDGIRRGGGADVPGAARAGSAPGDGPRGLPRQARAGDAATAVGVRAATVAGEAVTSDTGHETVSQRPILAAGGEPVRAAGSRVATTAGVAQTGHGRVHGHRHVLHVEAGTRPEPVADAFPPSPTVVPEPRSALTVETAPSQEDVSAASSADDADIVLQVVRQLRVSLRDGQRQVWVRLEPPSLGTVDVRVTESGGRLEVVLASADPVVRDALERGTDSLRRELVASGFAVQRVQVTVHATVADTSVGAGLSGGAGQHPGWGHPPAQHAEPPVTSTAPDSGRRSDSPSGRVQPVDERRRSDSLIDYWA